MELGGYTKLTLKDYPGHIAAICFTCGCPLKCPYCHNPEIVLFKNHNSIDNDNLTCEFLSYLEERKHQLEGAVISGGEPLQQYDLKSFLTRIKDKGLKVKIDTNGLYPDRLGDLINAGLVNYVALDFKSDKNCFARIIGLKSAKSKGAADNYFVNWRKSLDFLRQNEIPYEIRTTIVKELHSFDTLIKMAEALSQRQKENEKWYLQSFAKSGEIMNDYTNSEKKLSAYSKEEMAQIACKLSSIVTNVKVRE